MGPLTRILHLLTALAVAVPGCANATDEAWWSYRDAYRTLVRFDKQAQAKHLIQQRLQVQPLQVTAMQEGLRLTLTGTHTALDLPLDAALHTKVPLLKSAFDDNAVLQLNRGAEAFAFRVRIAIAPRPDGLYPLQELRQACEQVLGMQMQLDPAAHQGQQCVGVSFAFARHSSPTLSLRTDAGTRAWPLSPGPLYPGEPDRVHPTATLRWDSGLTTGTLATTLTPLVIAAWIE